MTTPVLRCWQCGVEPLDVIDVSTLGQRPGSSLMPGRWPDGDHRHELNPPTPEQLASTAYASRARTLEIWAE